MRHVPAPHPEPADDAAELAAALHREADDAPAGPAPVDAVVRRGRTRRLRRRAGLAATVVAAALLPVGFALWPSPSAPADRTTPPAATDRPSPDGDEDRGEDEGEGEEAPVDRLRVVEPYQPVQVAPDLHLALLPEGRQNSVLASADTVAEQVEWARGEVGDSIRPGTLSYGYRADRGRATILEGSWRMAGDTGRPERITVTAAGRTMEADLYTLPGDPGWGVWFLDVRALGPTTYLVEAYDDRGRKFVSRQSSVGF